MDTDPSTRDDFLRRVELYSARVDSALEDFLGREAPVPNLHDGLLYALGLDIADREAGGKRLRPVLCLMTADALGGDLGLAIDFACAIELMHNFALVHDDIEDGDMVRRNRPTVHVRYGLAHGVNIGDYLFCKVLDILARGDAPLDDGTRLRLLRLMSETLDHTHVGQCLDINARSSRSFGVEDYFRLAQEKTGYYLAAPMLGGAIIAGAGEPALDALAAFGRAAGPLFQITDDTLDLTTGKGRGGVVGSDIREGKRSYLVAVAASRASDAESARLFDILDAPRDATGDDDVAWVVGLFERTGTLDDARERCASLLDQGLAALAPLPGPLAGLLGAFARETAVRRR